jgi:HAD superfamily hydrolase (TIGR01490 family)
MPIALFDMDGTLIRSNTAALFHRFRRKTGEASLLDSMKVGFWLLQYKLGVVDAEHVATQAVATLTGKSEDWLVERCVACFDDYVRAELSQDAVRTVNQHRTQGDPLAIVTAASAYHATLVAKAFEIEHLVASELELSDGVFSGRFVPPLSYGAGKITRVERLASSLGVSLNDAVFYSDSVTDLPLLERVGTPVAVNPDARLGAIAKRRGWRIERWR